MPKRFHIKLSRVIPNSLQMCRSKDLSSTVQTPVPCRLSSFNPKSIDLSYSSFPSPPPSTPADVLKHRAPLRVAAARPLSRYAYGYSIESSSPDGFSGEIIVTENRKKLQEVKDRARVLCDDHHSGYFSSVEIGEENKETESLLCNSRSFSCDDTSQEFSAGGDTSAAAEEDGKKKIICNITRIHRKHRQQISRGTISPGPGDYNNDIARTKTTSRSPAKRGGGEGEVKEGSGGGAVEVVKKYSEDPYEDFKRSMMEMIVEKEIFEVDDLEELLRCFLSLNSRQHHGVIVKAFSEIWEVVFCDQY